MGDVVTITSDGLCGAAGKNGIALLFGGPQSHNGSAGGGNEVPITATRHGLVAHYRIPATYTAAYHDGQRGPQRQAPVRPGTGYGFYTLPAGLCGVPLTVLP
ncbi:MAG: hypothetical protein ACRDVG_15775 [Jatrophihabitantaceae bacterium]